MVTSHTPIEKILSRLPSSKRSGHGWKSKCPAHDDRTPSLSITEGKDKRVLLYCHAGCTTESIVAEMDLQMRDLAPPATSKHRHTESSPLKTYAKVDNATTVLTRKYGKPSHAWMYNDVNNNPVGVILRWDMPNGKTFRPISHNGSGWVIGGMLEPRPLYRLSDLVDAGRVYICEGEKAADAARSINLVATTSPHGSKSAAKCDWSPLAGKDVVIFPDNDDSGQQYCSDVVSCLTRLKPPPMVRAVQLPGLPDHGDIDDFISGRRHAGDDDDTIRAVIESLADDTAPINLESEGQSGEAKSNSGTSYDHKRGPSQADQLVQLAEDLTLFQSVGDMEDEFVAMPVSGHFENARINSRRFRKWLSRRFYEEHHKVPGSQALQDALNVIAGKAMHDNNAMPVAVRIAEYDDAYYIDLADADWHAIRITADKWEVVRSSDNPVRFLRPKGIQPLPKPEYGGDLNELRELVNVENDEQWTLMCAWLVQAIRPTGPYPILTLNGEQGSAKSTTCRLLRAVIDPNIAPVRSEPRDERDLMIAATNGWVVALDNLSAIRTSLSDALCRLATGGGFAVRQLYTDDDERLFVAQRPVLLNGITDLATRSDLLDRCITLTLPRISKNRRCRERVVFAAFNEILPRVFGALLDRMVGAMRICPDLKLPSLPRMADFAEWAIAAELASGGNEQRFLSAYAGNQNAIHEVAIESVVVGPSLVAFVHGKTVWTGTAGELLADLESNIDDQTRKNKFWPTNPRKLSNDLRRLAPNLREIGIHVDFYRGHDSSRRRLICLEYKGEISSISSGPSGSRSDASESPIAVRRCVDGADDRPNHDNSDHPPENGDSGPSGGLVDDLDGLDVPAHTCSGNDQWGEVQ